MRLSRRIFEIKVKVPVDKLKVSLHDGSPLRFKE